MTTSSRGYGAMHQSLREKLRPLVEGGHATCSRCRQPIGAVEEWDLDHLDDRSGYAGPAHAACNRRAGALKANASRGGARVSSRDWFGVGA